jgi:hypothetical protein
MVFSINQSEYSMLTLSSIIHVGDPVVMLPFAAAITASLLFDRSWKLAAWWTVLFGGGLALVVVSKILYIGWGNTLALEFKAISGHATLTSSVIPTVSYLLLQPFNRRLRMIGVPLAVGFSALISILLAILDFHSISECVAGFMLGTTVSMMFIRLAGRSPSPQHYVSQASGALLALALTLVLEPKVFDYLLTHAALAASGNEWPYSFSTGRPVHYIPPVPTR